MKKRNWLLNLVLAVLIFIPAIILSACGGGNEPPTIKYAWGKTFTYQGTVLNDLATKQNSGTAKGELLKAQYSNLNLAETTINGVTTDLSALVGENVTADQFITNLKIKASDLLTDYCNGVIVKIGTKEEQTITINNVSYDLMEYNASTYQIKPNDNESQLVWVGSFDAQLCENKNGQSLFDGLEISIFGISDIHVEAITISIPTISRIDDGGADDLGDGRTAISVTFTPYFNEAV